MSDLQRYVSIRPNSCQKRLETMGFYLFVHFGVNTFTGREWGTGKESPTCFNPTELDTDQWCAVASEIGAKGIILTAKHHDGFCLWQTETTPHSVRNSPFRNGKGDVLKELELSCKKFGLALGVYLSPWDRNAPSYGTEAYNDFYCRQLEELLTRYGDLFTVWLDGACGAHMDGKPVQTYDFARYFEMIRTLQPECAISNCGPDVRWVGNEAGLCRASEWNVVPRFSFDLQKVAEHSQQDESGLKVDFDVVSEDLGSRAVLSQFDDFIWYPAEVDVSIRKGWFYHPLQRPKRVDHLLNIYYGAVGGNCMLLLNIPPDKRGKFAERDVKRLKQFANRLQSAFANLVTPHRIDAPTGKPGMSAEDFADEKTYSPAQVAPSYRITFGWDGPKTVDKVVITENIDYSQRVEEFRISTVTSDGSETLLYRGTTIGHKKIALFRPTRCDNLIFTITACRLEPYIESFRIYEADFRQPRKPLFTELKRRLHRLSYRMFVKRTQKN